MSYIDDCIKMCDPFGAGENKIVMHNASTSFKSFLLECKMQIDRWDTVTQFAIFNLDLKDYIIRELGNSASFKIQEDDLLSIWGMDIILTKNIPLDTSLCLSNFTPTKSRDICMGKIDCEKIKRLWDLKSFW